MKAVLRFRLVCALALSAAPAIFAVDLPADHAGDIARQEVVTPVALDATDSVAALARQAQAALQTPAIFLYQPGITNDMAREVAAAFAQARSNFLDGLQETFHQAVLDEPTADSPDFGYFITAFNLRNRDFPINDNLARSWARGDDGLATQTNIIELLALALRRPVRPDELPMGFVLGGQARLVPAGNPEEPVTLDEAEQRGAIIASAQMATLSQAQARFRQAFPAEEQLIARSLAAYLRPNCTPDASLTQQARDRASAPLAESWHYDAGQVIVRRGQTIDTRILAALNELKERLPRSLADPGMPATNGSTQPGPGEAALAEALPGTVEMSGRTPARGKRDHWLALGLAAIAAGGLLVLGRLALRRRRVSLSRPHLPSRIPPELTPQLAQALGTAMVGELAAQRRELLQSQQIAAGEIHQWIHRLDELGTPFQKRLAAYQSRIEELERDLDARTEENREMLKAKIEMLRRQLETERAGRGPEVN